MKITKIEVQKKNKNRVNLYIDDEFFCGLSLEVILKYRIKENQEVSAERLDYFKNQTEKEVAFERAIKYISKVQKTENEIKKYLCKLGYEEEIIDATIEKLKEYHFVDDFEYAKAYVKYKSKSCGNKKIKYDLSLKGVEKNIIDKCLAEFSYEKESVFQVAKKYLRGKSLDKKSKEKIYRFLMGKGYNSSEISLVINELFSGSEYESWD